MKDTELIELLKHLRHLYILQGAELTLMGKPIEANEFKKMSRMVNRMRQELERGSLQWEKSA